MIFLNCWLRHYHHEIPFNSQCSKTPIMFNMVVRAVKVYSKTYTKINHIANNQYVHIAMVGHPQSGEQKTNFFFLVTMYYVSFVLPHIRANALALYIFITVCNVRSLMVSSKQQMNQALLYFFLFLFFVLFRFVLFKCMNENTEKDAIYLR